MSHTCQQSSRKAPSNCLRAMTLYQTDLSPKLKAKGSHTAITKILLTSTDLNKANYKGNNDYSIQGLAAKVKHREPSYYMQVQLRHNCLKGTESHFAHPGLGGLRAESSLAMVIWESRLSHRSRSSSLLINSNIRLTSLSPDNKKDN